MKGIALTGLDNKAAIYLLGQALEAAKEAKELEQAAIQTTLKLAGVPAEEWGRASVSIKDGQVIVEVQEEQNGSNR